MDKTNLRTTQILKLLRLFTWIAYIGFSIEAGAIILTFVISCFNPEAARHLYKGEDLYALRSLSFPHYFLTVFFRALAPMLKATVCHLVIKVLTIIRISHPFTYEVAGLLVKSSYLLLSVWIVAALGFIHDQWVLKIMSKTYEGELGGESLLMAGLVFVIAQVFKRGVEIQSENELTV